ncbi:class I SAM-dependent methyltransferase [Nonomuraea wenchangensis]|uniref:Methyltransferase domain-containing protein n=1 Tax=Nonomuraea wenchangensis TaxID=568860 RepID=A0A1I0I2P4_9ACTN|nr:class I SAM-dependent methyltransferase [Nonomuraea wenchangensis]SET90779.1 Methyltransferase domain-containing protein [Nonomuraea wenchangensis]
MPFDHNDHYHRTLLRRVPPGCARALDVGCGAGRFARRLAARGIEVDAVDPAAEVIEAARAAGGGPRFLHADITDMELPEGHYDFVSCLASIHHVPFATVSRLRRALAPGGVLAVLGCYRETSAADLAWSLAAVPVNAVARAAVTVRERGGESGVRAPVRQPEMSLAEIRGEAAGLLPGARIRRLLFWRYLLVHREPA